MFDIALSQSIILVLYFLFTFSFYWLQPFLQILLLINRSLNSHQSIFNYFLAHFLPPPPPPPLIKLPVLLQPPIFLLYVFQPHFYFAWIISFNFIFCSEWTANFNLFILIFLWILTFNYYCYCFMMNWCLCYFHLSNRSLSFQFILSNIHLPTYFCSPLQTHNMNFNHSLIYHLLFILFHRIVY